MEETRIATREETRLVQAARRDDPAAWEGIVEMHREVVFRLAYLHLGDPDDAQDLAQEVFLRAWRRLDQFDADRPLRPWLLAITANLARNRRRSIGRYLAALKRKLQNEPPPTLAGAELGERHLQAQRLWQAVNSLRSDDRQVIYLRYYLELSVDETARSLDVALGTVKSRTYRALGRLREVVEQEFPDLAEEERAR